MASSSLNNNLTKDINSIKNDCFYKSISMSKTDGVGPNDLPDGSYGPFWTSATNAPNIGSEGFILSFSSGSWKSQMAIGVNNKIMLRSYRNGAWSNWVSV